MSLFVSPHQTISLQLENDPPPPAFVFKEENFNHCSSPSPSALWLAAETPVRTSFSQSPPLCRASLPPEQLLQSVLLLLPFLPRKTGLPPPSGPHPPSVFLPHVCERTLTHSRRRCSAWVIQESFCVAFGFPAALLCTVRTGATGTGRFCCCRLCREGSVSLQSGVTFAGFWRQNKVLTESSESVLINTVLILVFLFY